MKGRGGEDEDGAGSILAAVQEAETGRGRGGLGGGDFDDEMAVGGEPFGQVSEGEELGGEIGVAVAFAVGRVGEDEIVAGGIAAEEGEDLGLHAAPTLKPRFLQVFSGHGHRLAVLVHEYAGRRATA